MFKNKLDFKLINLALFAFVLFIVYQTGNLWLGIFAKIWKILLPFLAAFVIAYAFHPLLKFLESKKIPKPISIFLIVAIFLGILVITVMLIAPLLFNQLSSLFNYIITFLKELSVDYDINSGTLQETLSNSFNDIISSLGKYVSDGAMNAINISLGMISNFFVTFALSIYFLIDFDAIREKIKTFLYKTNKRTYRYFKELDKEMKAYLSGFVRIMFITLIEYTLAYYIIGHPNALLLGFLAVIGGLIPYFGGMLVNVIAAVTAFVAQPGLGLFIRTCITFFVLSNIDGYIINPTVYGKTNQVHPLIVIFSVFAGGILFGFLGIVISLPLAIVIITTLKFYHNDITLKIGDIKEDVKDKRKQKDNF